MAENKKYTQFYLHLSHFLHRHRNSLPLLNPCSCASEIKLRVKLIGLNCGHTFEAESRWWPRAGAALEETRFGVV